MIDLLVESVSKRYLIRGASDAKPGGRLGRLTTRTEQKVFWALQNINFQVRRGESLGIIGHNGAGKSTMLKLLSNITTPTTGKITINGRMSALLEVGSGFHPDLTGRENTYLSGSILGMRRSEIAKKLDSIIDFAEIRQFIDIPVKRYSSGMYVRLGFSIAAHLDPDILLLDEVLAVGDMTFQEKCKKRIGELHKQGMTMIFISHDLNAVQDLCQRAILLKKGEIVGEGAPEDVIRQYTETGRFRNTSRVEAERRVAEIRDVKFLDESGGPCTGFSTGRPLRVRVDWFAHSDLPDTAITIYFLSIDGHVATQFSTALRGLNLLMKAGPGSLEFTCDELGLQAGVYQIDACVENPQTRKNYEWLQHCASIHVQAAYEVRGVFMMPHDWKQLN